MLSRHCAERRIAINAESTKNLAFIFASVRRAWPLSALGAMPVFFFLRR